MKNDHLGFEVFYVRCGVVRKYRPDFLVRLKSGEFLVQEAKGRDTDRDCTKRMVLAEWVEAVKQHGGFGRRGWDVATTTIDIRGILAHHLCTDA